jgi:hypothetical protein
LKKDSDLEFSLFKQENNSNVLKQNEIEEYKRRKEREKKALSTLKEIFFYIIFIWVIFIISYGTRDVKAYHYQRMLNTLFDIQQYCDLKTGQENCFNEVKKSQEVWHWIRESFLYKFKIASWYNNRETGLNSYMLDLSSFLVGDVFLRQMRIINGWISSSLKD